MIRLSMVTFVALLLLASPIFAVKVATVNRPADIPSFVGYVQDECILVLKENAGGLNPVMNARGQIAVGEAGLDAIAARMAVSGMRKQFQASKDAVFPAARDLSRFYKVRFGNGNLQEVLNAYRKHPLIENAYAIPIHVTYATPNDGFFGDQRHLFLADQGRQKS